MDLRKAGLFPLIIVAVLFLLMLLFRPGQNLVFNSPGLLLALNFLLITVVGIAIAAISAKSYINGGSMSILFLGMAISVLAIAALLSGWASVSSANLSVTIFDIGVFFSGALQLLSAISTITGSTPNEPPTRKIGLIIGYSSVIIFFVGVSALAFLGYSPAFFTASGPTVTRQWVLVTAILLFASSSVILVFQYRLKKPLTLYWYSLGLALFAIGLFGSTAYIVPDDVINWAARLAQYSASFYFLMSLLAARKIKSFQATEDTNFAAGWADAFRNDRRQMDTLFGEMSDGFALCKVKCDGNGRPTDYIFLDVNDAFERLTGLKREKVLNRRVSELLPGIERDPADWIGVCGHVALTGEPAKFENYAEPLKKWYGVSVYSPRKGYFVSLFSDITERRKAEQALKTSEEKYRLLVQYAPTGIFELDYRNLKFKTVNDVICQILGYTREELLSMGPDEILDEASARLFKDRAMRVMAGGQIEQNAEVGVKTKDGRKLWAALEVKLNFEDGQAESALVIAHDITERKNVEEILFKAKNQTELERKRLEVILGTTPSAVIVVEADGKFSYLNKRAMDLYGIDCSGFDMDAYTAKVKVLKLDGTPYPAEETPISRSLNLGQEIRNEEMTIERADGTTLPVLMSSAPLFNAESKITAAVAAFEDIGERKKMEDALRRSQDELERRVRERTEKIREQAELLDETNDAVVVRDLGNHIIYWNKGAERMYGWTSEETLNRNAGEFLCCTPERYPQVLGEVMSKGVWSGEIKHFTKKQGAIIVDSRWTLVSDADHKPKSILTINTDVTERKNLEAQYFRAQRLESLGILAGGIAHDFRNILTPVMIGLELIDQHLTEKEDHDIVAMLQRNLQRGADLSKQLLTSTRGAEGVHIPISVSSIISEIEKTIRETFPKSIRIQTKLDSVLPLLMGDPTQLHQVLINMCINARDAMPFGGTLNITAETASVNQYYAKLHPDAKIGSYVVISVTDDGVGMSSEVLDHIFEPFFTTKKPGEGTGLGLSTARSIVKNHGGFITVGSEEGKGATFRIYLPTQEAKGEQQEIAKASGPYKGNGQLILVVDDEAPIRAIISAALENGCYTALEASDGAEALTVYMEHRDSIKAVLLDMAMPIMDGEATIRALRKINPGLKIIGMSGLADNGKYTAMHKVTNAFITKPFTTETMLETLAMVVLGN